MHMYIYIFMTGL